MVLSNDRPGVFRCRMVPMKPPTFPRLLLRRLLPVSVLLRVPWSVRESFRIGAGIVEGQKGRGDNKLMPVEEQRANKEHTIGGKVHAEAPRLQVCCVHTNGKHRRVPAMYIILPRRRGYSPAMYVDPLTT